MSTLRSVCSYELSGCLTREFCWHLLPRFSLVFESISLSGVPLLVQLAKSVKVQTPLSVYLV
jgi:hypothetical protein